MQGAAIGGFPVIGNGTVIIATLKWGGKDAGDWKGIRSGKPGEFAD